MEGGLLSASLGGSGPGAYEPPSLGPEPAPAPRDFAAPVFGQTNTHNPVHVGSASPVPSFSGVRLAPAAAEALTIQVDTSLDPNGFDISDGVASGDDCEKAAQMFRKRERAKQYDADMTARTASIGKNIALAFVAVIVIGAIVAVYAYVAASAAGDDGSVNCAANNTVTRNTCTAIDSSREEDVVACNNVVTLTDSVDCKSLRRHSASPGDPPGPALCRYASRTECRQTAGPREPAPSPPRDSSPPPTPPRPTTAAETWDFIGGAEAPDSEGKYAAGAGEAVWPGARSGSATWSRGGSVFLLGGIGCGEVADGVCGDAAWAQNGPEQPRGSFGTTPGKRVPRIATCLYTQCLYSASLSIVLVWLVCRLPERSMGVGRQHLDV